MTATGGSGAGHVGPSAAELIRRHYSPCKDTATQVADCLQSVVEEGLAGWCAVHMARRGSIQVIRNGREVIVDELREESESARAGCAVRGDNGGHEGASSSFELAGEAKVLLITYCGREIGSLAWDDAGAVGPAPDDRFFRDLAMCLAYHLNRVLLGAKTAECLGQGLVLVGASDAMNQLEEQVEKAAGVDLPVLIRGEFGTEKVQVACALHYGGQMRSGPFIEVRCSTLRPDKDTPLHDLLARANGGSLFLNGIDELHAEMQVQLLRILGSRVRQWAGRAEPSTPAVRLIASTTRSLRELVERDEFSAALFAELSFLPIQIPALRQRRGDLKHLASSVLMRYGEPNAEIETDVLEAIGAYDWPQNLFEMERVLSRLVVLRRSNRIGLEDVAQLAPRLVQNSVTTGSGEPASAEGPDDGTASDDNAANSSSDRAANIPIERLARHVLDGTLEGIAHWHAGIQRALRSIGDAYQDGMTLSELAEAAYVSPSHLCYLFKSTLGVTFKGFLGLVRIERAKQLLVEEPRHRITDISLDVGFGDLSHFEKTFKRIVKASPREYRRRQLEELRKQGLQAQAESSSTRGMAG